MDIEKAIEVMKKLYVKSCMKVNGRLKGGFIDKEKEENVALNRAIEALEKQIPKKPYRNEHDEMITFLNCPNCKYLLLTKYLDDLTAGKKSKHCPDCGQKIDWSDE